jgi:uncharacterized protein
MSATMSATMTVWIRSATVVDPLAAPETFSVPIGREWLVVGPRSGVRARVNRAARDCLALPPSKGDPVASLREPLLRAQCDAPAPRTGALQPRFLGLIPTRACNGACVYCAFGAAGAAETRMDHALATEAIDWFASHARAMVQPDFEVHFFGGEPFIAPDVVEVAVHRARVQAASLGLRVRFHAATSGQFDADLCDWAGRHFHTLALSLDGQADVHDLHRPLRSGTGSWAQAVRAARRLADAPTQLCIRVCVSSANVDGLEELARWLSKDFRPTAIDFETLRATPQSAAAGLRAPDPYRFASGFWRASLQAAMRSVRATFAAADLSCGPRASFCPVGNDALIVTPDGRVSACYLPCEEWQRRGLALDLGRVRARGGVQLDAEKLERVRGLASGKPGCSTCFCRWSCAGGCHVHHGGPPADGGYDAMCIQTRIVTACAHLAEMGDSEVASELVQSAEAMKQLALWPDDTLGEK